MKLGTAWEDITPTRLLPLLGQMNQRIATHARDPLTVNAVVFDDGRERVAVVSIDVCLLPAKVADRLRQACATDIDPANVHVAATHTHLAPCTTRLIDDNPDPDFLQRLQTATAAAVRRAIADIETVELFAGRGYLQHMGWNRRGMRRDGSCHMYWGSWKEDFVGVEGPRDGDVGVIFARKPSGGPVKAVLSSFSTHPNCIEGESFYSADLPGELRRVLRAALGQHLGVVYLTGTAGDTAPSIMLDNPKNLQPWRNESGLQRSGIYLASEILKVISQRISPMTDPVLRHEPAALKIPIRPWTMDLDLDDPKSPIAPFHDLIKQSQEDWPRMLREESPVACPVSVLRLGDAAICFNPGELFCAFGLAIKEKSPARVTLVSELTDDWVGYVPTPEAIRHGGYGAMPTTYTRLIPEAGWLMVEKTHQLLAQAWR